MLSIKTGDIKTRVQALQDDMNKLNGYFNELIVEFGESKDDYTVDSFFKVLVDFYDIFMNELTTLEKKKKDAEELRKRMENQEKMTRSIHAHAMDSFQNKTKGLNSEEVVNKIKQKAVRESRMRQSLAPTLNVGVASRPSFWLSRQFRFSGNKNQLFRERDSNLGVDTEYLNSFDDRRESFDSYISDVASMDTEELEESEGDEGMNILSHRK